jgi:hypothetical protein
LSWAFIKPPINSFQNLKIKSFKVIATPPHHALPPGSFSNKPVETPLAIVSIRTVLMHGVPKQ